MAHERRLDLRVANLDCENEAAAIVRRFKSVPGVLDVAVNASAARVTFRIDERSISAEAVAASLREAGFPPRAPEASALPAPWRNPKVVTSAVSGLTLLAGWLASSAGAPRQASVALYLAALVVGAYYFAREALEDLLREREIGIELLMTVAAVVSTVMGEPGEGAMLAFLYSISEAAEGYTAEKTRAAVRALMKLAPKTAVVVRDGKEVEVAVEEISVGDVFRVRPGQAIATDGEIVSGTSAINEAPVTGESVPVEKKVGDVALAGTINGEGALEVRATKVFAENTLSRIIQMVEEAHERKGTSQRFIERFGRIYSPIVLLVGVLVAVIPVLVTGAAWAISISRATVFVVAAAPCALVISIPITLVAALGTGARNGVLIKGGIHLEQLARVRVVALDKTGTLTRGEPQVTDVVLFDAAPSELKSEDGMLSAAAGIERWSEHPLARAVVRASETRGIAPRAAIEFRSHTGAGAEAQLEGRRVLIGSPTFLARQIAAAPGNVRASIEQLQERGKTVIAIGEATGVWAVLALRDELRANARDAVANLRAVGIQRVVMLTGDNARTAQAIAEQAGVDEVFAGLRPEDKVSRVRQLRKDWGATAMVGDGVNDAPALAEADVGVAMGAAGTDVALETADVALMADDLAKLVEAVRLAKRNASIVRQNLVLSGIVIAALVGAAIVGRLTLPAAVVAHELSEFVVIASGLRMLRRRER
ncbi:MAG: cation-translocating P-type ATPase [Labilithrix sp.]|nr:cation-translocating P-type ATPase [Labilithrix sp.]MCW5811568.1 cation-translocating P-type ATPase [Labilithrix sp.]